MAKNGKTYELYALAAGSGYFVNRNGYIVTNAHVTSLTENQDKGEVIGIVTYAGTLDDGTVVPNFTFIVPSNTIMAFCQQAGGLKNSVKLTESKLSQRRRIKLDGH